MSESVVNMDDLKYFELRNKLYEKNLTDDEKRKIYMKLYKMEKRDMFFKNIWIIVFGVLIMMQFAIRFGIDPLSWLKRLVN